MAHESGSLLQHRLSSLSEPIKPVLVSDNRMWNTNDGLKNKLSRRLRLPFEHFLNVAVGTFLLWSGCFIFESNDSLIVTPPVNYQPPPPCSSVALLASFSSLVWIYTHARIYFIVLCLWDRLSEMGYVPLSVLQAWAMPWTLLRRNYLKVCGITPIYTSRRVEITKTHAQIVKNPSPLCDGRVCFFWSIFHWGNSEQV